MNKDRKIKDRTTDITRLVMNEKVKSFRMIRSTRDGKTTASMEQLRACEILLRAAMEFERLTSKMIAV